MPKALNPFSSQLTQPTNRAISQAMLYATGLSDQDMNKPQVGIASVWWEGNPCNMHLLDLSEKVKQGVTGAGMVGMRFNTIGVSDGISMGTDGMSYSLQSREIIADSIVQKDLNTQNKVDAELWTNGFCPPPDFPNCGRLCFAAHVASTPHTYSGGYNQQLASNIQYEFTFSEAVRYKIVAVQLQRVEIDASGQMTASLS